MPRAKAAPTLEELVARMRGLHARLVRAKRTVATAESCTGGLLGAVLTAHGGASSFYRGGAVVYADEAKTTLADVAPQLLHAHGAVSAVVAQALATGARQGLRADIGLGVTGIAGPGGATPGKPVGLVYAAVDSDAASRVQKAQFGFDREGNRLASVALGLDLLEEALIGAGAARGKGFAQKRRPRFAHRDPYPWGRVPPVGASPGGAATSRPGRTAGSGEESKIPSRGLKR